MEDGNWFLYAAMIVIAFVSWVFNKIQEATAARRRGEEIEQYRDDDDEDSSWDEEELIRQAEPEPAPPPPVPTSAEDAMRKLVEALGGTPVKAPQPPPPREIQKAAAPAKTQRPRLSAAEQAALERVKMREEVKSVARKRPKGDLASMSIADLVRDPGGIRKAVVLREVFDRPRSERPWEWE